MQYLGMIAGLLNKLGKIGVIVGFCLGNAAITYFTNGNTVPIITIREILIASLGLLLIPKTVKIDIEDIIGKTKYLPTTGGVLEGSTEEAVNKLNTFSETISEMARSCNDVANENTQTDLELKIEARESFKDELINNIEDFTENILYDDLIEDENILDDIYELLEEKEDINKEELFEIFQKNNNYIIGVDEENKNEQVEEDVKNIVKAVNQTYRINKLNIVWKQKEAAHKKMLANQLGGVSKVISSIADNIEETTEKTIKTEEKPQYKVEIVSTVATKNKSEISGDTFIHTKLHDGKFMMAISDGMGSGKNAKKSSSTVIKMLERLLTTGFDKDVSIGLINSAVNLNSTEDTYATIDLSVIDVNNGEIEFIKNGASPTFIKNKNKVEVIKSVELPAGIVDNIDLVVYNKKVAENNIIVMCSDGILESNEELANKEIWVKDFLENIETEDIKEIADLLLNEAINNGNGIAQDDMTVLVAKIKNIV